MKNKSLIIVFLILLVGPNIIFSLVKDKIDSENHENRIYEEFPSLDAQHFEQYTQQLETYYEDRVPFKNQFTRANSKMEVFLHQWASRYELFSDVPTVLVGKNDWLYYMIQLPGENSVEEYQGVNTYSEEQLQNLAKEYQTLSEYYSLQGIEMVLAIIPNKEQVYKEYLPEYFSKTPEASRGEQLVHYLEANTTVKTLYPVNALDEARDKHETYYKYDTHWNFFGTYVFVQELNRVLNGRKVPFENITIAHGDIVIKDLANVLGMGNDYNDDFVTFIGQYDQGIQIESVERSETGDYVHIVSNAEDNRTIVAVVDSFGAMFDGFLPYDYKEVYIISNLELAKEIIEESKPDIVLFESVQRKQNVQEMIPVYFMSE